MEETLTEIFQNKIVDILLVAVILWIGVFIINRLVRLFLNGRTLLKKERKNN